MSGTPNEHNRTDLSCAPFMTVSREDRLAEKKSGRLPSTELSAEIVVVTSARSGYWIASRSGCRLQAADGVTCLFFQDN